MAFNFSINISGKFTKFCDVCWHIKQVIFVRTQKGHTPPPLLPWRTFWWQKCFSRNIPEMMPKALKLKVKQFLSLSPHLKYSEQKSHYAFILGSESPKFWTQFPHFPLIPQSGFREISMLQHLSPFDFDCHTRLPCDWIECTLQSKSLHCRKLTARILLCKAQFQKEIRIRVKLTQLYNGIFCNQIV